MTEAATAEEQKTDNPESGESMEDILHSIRRIIANEPEGDEDADEEPLELTEVVAEGDAVPESTATSPSSETIDIPQDAPAEEAAPPVTEEEQAPAAEPAPEPEPAPEAAIEEVAAPEEISVEEEPEEIGVPMEPEPTPEPVVVETASEEPTPTPIAEEPETEPAGEAILNEDAANASSGALKSLVDSIPKPQVDNMSLRSGSTLEELVVESMKPELSAWLNKNLPIIVENLVQKEIRKLIPRD